MPLLKNALIQACTASLGILSMSTSFAGLTNVDFTATAQISEYLLPTPTGPCPFAGMSTGSGTATHIGKILLTATDCVTPQADGSFVFSNGKLVLTAINGDAVFATYGPGSFIALTPGPIYTINHATYVITGGTGLFKNATGRGELRGTENISTIPATGQLQAIGFISLPQSEKDGVVEQK